MAKDINIVLNRNSHFSGSPSIPVPVPPVEKMIGFWGTVTEVHPENCTCRVRMASGYVIANVRVMVQSWVTVDDDKGYLSGERYLPPVDTFVLCVCPEGNLADTVIIGSCFALSAAVHADFKTNSDDQKELDNAANTRKIVRNSGWTFETDYRNGTKKIRNAPEEGDATISIEVNQGENGEKADGGVTTIKAYGTTLSLKEKDNKITFETDADVKIEIKGNAEIKVDKDAKVEAQNVTVKSSVKTEIKGGQVVIGGTVTPTGKGALCGLPSCLFTGAPHIGDTALNA